MHFADEKIAVEYLLEQSGRGDLLAPVQSTELGVSIPDMQLAENESEGIQIEDHDETVCNASDINMGISQAAPHHTSQPSRQPSPRLSELLQEPLEMSPENSQQSPQDYTT